jgi:hypothetical protein
LAARPRRQGAKHDRPAQSLDRPCDQHRRRDAARLSRYYFRDGLIISSRTPTGLTTGKLVLGSLWHFDPRNGDTWLIRHVPTGLTYRQAPQIGDRFALQAVSIDAEFADWPEAALYFVGRGARLVALHASAVASCRWHKGAVFFRYTLDDPNHPYQHSYTEDAPALS